MDLKVFVLPFYILATFIKNKKIKIYVILLLVLTVVYFKNGSTREYIDTWNYRYEYFNNSFDNIKLQSKGILFDYLGQVIRKIFGDNYKIYFLIIALLITYPIIEIIKRHTKSEEISLFFLYSYLMMYTTGILRQGIAAVFVFIALVIPKNIVSVILIIIASLSHRSAILILPVIYLRSKKYPKKLLYFIILISYIITICYPLNEIIIKNLHYLEHIMGKEYILGYKDNQFVNLGEYKIYRIYTLYYLGIGTLMIKYRKSILNKGLKNEFYNIVLISIFCMGIFGSIIIARRVIDYLKIMEVFLWPCIIYIFPKNSRAYIYILLLFQVIIINIF